jgi:phenylacetate-CoA ligase
MTLDPVESAPREELRALQLGRLRATVARLLEDVGPIGDRLRATGVEQGDDIRSLADLQHLPFTDKSDLRDHYPFGLLAVPRERLVRVHASSGTGGKPTVAGYTAADLGVWTRVMARCMAMAGVGAGTVVHNAYGYGLFTGGLGFHHGAEALGATVIPVSSGRTSRQATLLRDLRAEALCCTPSYALHIAETLDDAGIDPDDLSLRVGLFGAEPWSDSMRAQVERGLGLTALDVYGLSEIVGPGVAAECPEGRDGLHVQEDHFLPEEVDGELVFTTLTKEALPLLRYRTGDVAALTTEPCACGRTLARMAAVRGRRDDMLIVRGVNLYPSEVERILLGVEGIGPHYQLVLGRNGALDALTVRCEPAEGAPEPALARRAEHALREATGLSIEVELAARGEVARSEGKAVRVVDARRTG